jgi:hypothetical protein
VLSNLFAPLARRSDTGAWSEGLEALPDDALRARYGLIAERLGDDHLDLAWTDGRTTIHRDVEVAVELLCDHLSTALDRIEAVQRTAAALGEKPGATCSG